MKIIYLFKKEKIKLEIADPTIFNSIYGRVNGSLLDYRVFQMETTVSNFQSSDSRDDPEQKQFCKDLMEKLRLLVKSPDVTKDDKGVGGSAKKRRIERNPTLKISMGVLNKVSDKGKGNDNIDNTIIGIDGEFITALHQMCLSFPRTDVKVRLALLTDLLSSPPEPICKKNYFSVTTEEMCIGKGKNFNSTECCHHSINLPDFVKNTLMSSKEDNKLKIGGQFTIAIFLKNFEESLVSPKALNQAILNDAGLADVVICTSDGKEIPCHRLFLAVNSAVLKAKLQSGVQESSIKIEMSNMSEESVRAFLAFLYYRDLAPAKEKISIAWELLQAAEKYKVIPLRTSMEKILLENDEDSWWTVETALQIFTFMNKIDSDLKEDVKRNIVQIMKKNHTEWMSSEVYHKMLKENPTLNAELLKAAFSLCSCNMPINYVTITDSEDCY